MRQVKKGEVWRVQHSRKGTFDMQFNKNYDLDVDEFVGGVVVAGMATGYSGSWMPGEPLDMRSSFLTLVKLVGEPLKTTEERHG